MRAVGASAMDPAATANGAPSALSSRSFQTFGAYSQFLRAAVADEESLQLGESLQALAAPIESLVGLLR